MINLLDQLESLVLGLVIILIARHIIESFLWVKLKGFKMNKERIKIKDVEKDYGVKFNTKEKYCKIARDRLRQQTLI